MENNAVKLILAVETTGPVASVALAWKEAGGVRISERTAEAGYHHLTCLVPMIEQILREEAVPLAAPDALAVSAGPGSFTGIRIGISAVRAMAQALGKPVIKVPTLETFAFQVPEGSVAVPMFDARREQVYAGAYRLDGGALNTLVAGGAYAPEEFETLLKGYNSIFRFGDYVSGGVQRAQDVARWALAFGVPQDYRTVEPIYMRKAEAQRKLEAGLLKAQPAGAEA
jgi:tRNA threonylcarbamoyladenosine biosynthesis protein TsaB